ncbi:hypothetical protein BC826DRAFT_971229 [Russula brevipes]|nr:hypothetical protein BC826DRAFT_971229 [Russula brevipes]
MALTPLPLPDRNSNDDTDSDSEGDLAGATALLANRAPCIRAVLTDSPLCMLLGWLAVMQSDPARAHVDPGVARSIVTYLVNTPKDYVLVECIEKEKGGPYRPRGMIRSLAATLCVYDAFNGLVLPNWGHLVPEAVWA